MGKIHWIPVDPTEPERIEESNKEPDHKEIQAYLGGWSEHVKVLYKGQFPTSMFVKDDGRLMNLPVNKRATDIYWAASAARGVNLANKAEREADSEAFWRSRGVDPTTVITLDPQPDDPPFIHGPAVLLEGIRVR